VNLTDREFYRSYRDDMTPYFQGGFQMQTLGLQRIQLETVRLSYDKVLAVVGAKLAFSRAADGGGMVECGDDLHRRDPRL
jgi:hypothetical protein